MMIPEPDGPGLGLAEPSQKQRMALGGAAATRRSASVLAAAFCVLVLDFELPNGFDLGS